MSDESKGLDVAAEENEDYSLEELKNQEWPEPADTSGYITHEFMDGTEMVFECQDPETEVIMDYIGPEVGDQDQSERQFGFVTSTVVNPQIPLERWQQWRPADRMALTRKIAEWAGVDRVVDFRAEDLEDLMSDSQAE